MKDWERVRSADLWEGIRYKKRGEKCSLWYVEGVAQGESTDTGQQASRQRPRTLPSQTDSCVFNRNCSRGPPHSWKQLHKLVNLEDWSPPPHFDSLMMKQAEGKHDAHRHLFMRPTHTCRGDILSIRDMGVLPQWSCIPLAAGHRGCYCMIMSGCCVDWDSVHQTYSFIFILKAFVLVAETYCCIVCRLEQHYKLNTLFFHIRMFPRVFSTSRTN